jgi:hypothetical protein
LAIEHCSQHLSLVERICDAFVILLRICNARFEGYLFGAGITNALKKHTHFKMRAIWINLKFCF